MKAKPIIYTAVIVIVAAWVYRLLYTGGWLSHHYEFNDPNVVNLLLAIIEPITVVIAVAYWIWRARRLYRLLFFSFIVQLLVGAGFVAFIGFFILTWKPKMM
jgi:hypothetical protein